MQEHLTHIFQRLKAILKAYEGPFTPKFDLDSKYDLWSIKNIEIAGRKRKEIYFAGLIIQSKYVGFYYMPIYTDTDLKEVFEPDLLKLLKGKSCFHIKELDTKLEKQISRALKIGFNLYKARAWV
ncbi:MAG: DUF1801 domain-containing protein [Candidatus Thorarchaeota archaeon]|nr:DUF1801 domain-containing protein [Candidatus Thorarchaeota archaeon]